MTQIFWRGMIKAACCVSYGGVNQWQQPLSCGRNAQGCLSAAREIAELFSRRGKAWWTSTPVCGSDSMGSQKTTWRIPTISHPKLLVWLLKLMNNACAFREKLCFLKINACIRVFCWHVWGWWIFVTIKLVYLWRGFSWKSFFFCLVGLASHFFLRRGKWSGSSHFLPRERCLCFITNENNNMM